MSTYSHLQLPPTDSPSQVLGTSDSLSCPSEPPDIRNWFGSYVYESPELNTLDGLPDLGGFEEFCFDGVNGEKSEKTRNTGEFEEGSLAEEKDSLDGIVDRIGPDEFEHGTSAAALDIHDVEPKTMQLALKSVGEQKLPGETGCNNHGSITKSRAARIYDRGDDTKLEHSLIDITNDSMFHKKYIRRNVAKSSLEKENLYDATPGTLGLMVPKEDSWKGPIETAKENDGFVSTRKKRRQADTMNVMPKDGPRRVTNCEKGSNKSRNVLFDKSDFHYSNVQEDTGKWQCPQKKKPNLGPALKQLRLEHWVHLR